MHTEKFDRYTFEWLDKEMDVRNEVMAEQDGRVVDLNVVNEKVARCMDEFTN